MGTDPCNRYETDDEWTVESDATAERWIGSDPVTDAALPADVRSTLGEFLGREPVDTLDEWAAAIRRRTDGDALSAADLSSARSRPSAIAW